MASRAAPSRLPPPTAPSPPDVIALAEALARAAVARDIAALRAQEDSPRANRHLRTLQQR